MESLQLIDLRFGGRPRAIGVYLVDTSDGPALFDCGPSSTLDGLDAGLAAHGLEPIEAVASDAVTVDTLTLLDLDA